MDVVSGHITGLWQRLHHQYHRILFVYLLMLKRRLTWRKVANLLANSRRYAQLSPAAGASPSVVLFDTTNRCNLRCQTCRRSQTDIVDLSGQTEKPVHLGDMTLCIYERIIDDLHRDMLLATLYVSGEPLLNKDIVAMVSYSSRKNVASMISTNGMQLDGRLSAALLEAGLDYLKVAVSGFTQDVYGVYHQGGDVVKVLENVANFERIRRKLGKRCMVVVDYILFEHNRHQVADIKQFCRSNGISSSVRYGRTLEGSGLLSPVESGDHYLPKTKPCDWLWKIMVFCADGRAVPCCQFATCAESPFVMGSGGSEGAAEIWNGELYQRLRRLHAHRGRRGLPLCGNCFYSDIDFQS